MSILRQWVVLLAGGMFFLAGCAGERKYAMYLVSSADEERGGMYRYDFFENGDWMEVDHVAAPSLNYLVLTGDRSRAYGSAGVGAVYFFDEAKRSSPDATGQVPASGTVSCHVALSKNGKFLYLANYGDGSISEFCLDAEGKPALRNVVATSDAAPEKTTAGHAHFVGFTPDGKWLVAVDLGLDAILLYPFDEADGICEEGVAKMDFPPGSGPRHLIWLNEQMCFVANELNSTVSSLSYHDGAFRLLDTVSTTPENFEGKNYPGAIRLSPDGKWILVSNRGMNSIALCRFDKTGKLTLTTCVDSAGDWPRDLQFSPDGKWVVVANERSGNAAFFTWEEGKLVFSGKSLALAQVSNVVF